MPPLFVPKHDELHYYKIKTPAVDLESSFYTTFIQPWNPPKDRTHGRFDLPFSPCETAIRDNPAYNAWDGRAFLNDEKTEWVFYQVSRPMHYRACIVTGSWAGLGSQTTQEP